MNAMEWTVSDPSPDVNWETQTLFGLQRMRNPVFTAGMRFATFLANSSTLTLFALLAFVLPVLNTVASPLAIALLSGVGGSQIVKRWVRRARPRRSIAGLIPIGEDPDSFSMPSGHTTAAFAGGLVLATLPGWGVGAVCFACLVGLSRMYMGAHYPTDVLAGAALGSLCATVALAITTYLPAF